MDLHAGIVPSRRATICASLAGLTTARHVGAQTGASGPRTATAGHVVLLGDSTVDNRAYVGGEPDVVTQLRACLPEGWQATLAAVDGAVMGNVAGQLSRVPADSTHLIVSVGGNDALRSEGILGDRAHSVGEALARLAALRERFQEDYRAMLDMVLGRRLPTAACMVYDPRFPNPVRQRLATAGLALFNDVIARLAFARGLPLIDLRLVCDEDADFANPIEPSVQGGRKIAAEIARLVSTHNFARRQSEVFTGRPRGDSQ